MAPGRVRIPRASYRLQFTEAFTFSDAAELVPYLAELGISDVYASPYLRARPGSTHGYDVVDPTSLNPELGGEEAYGRLVEALEEQGIGQLLDIVPNHMGVGSDNAWWVDVLENGPASEYASFFDIDWCPIDRKELCGKVLLPVLGDHYRAALERGELRLAFEEGSFSVNYYEHRCPIDPQTYPMILDGISLPGEDEHSSEIERLVFAFGDLPRRDDTAKGSEAERARNAANLKADLASLCAKSSGIMDVVEERISQLNEGMGEPSFEGLHLLFEAQAYRLAYWWVGSDEINYRRFFAVNELAGIRVEDPLVFDTTHGFILQLVEKGAVNGLRIDHPDGLRDPGGYLSRLKEAVVEASGGPIYTLVEKILAHNERLPEDWPVSGTTGYEFTNLLNGLFVDLSGEDRMDEAYESFIGRPLDFQSLLYECKHKVMRTVLSSELNALSRRLRRISEHRRSHDFSVETLRKALSEVIAHFPVYRTYIVPGRVSGIDRRHVDLAMHKAKEKSTGGDPGVFDFIRDVVLLQGPEENEAGAFTSKFQQYTGPVMAKGMEDCALYIYHRLISLNEVGGEPEIFGVSVPEFHRLNAERLERWPHSMLSTSTHDTKRSEDVRARINVLSEIPDEWIERVVSWSGLNSSFRREVEEDMAPSRNDEYLLYQTLLGAWPPGEPDRKVPEAFRKRIKEYMEKAMREAQVRTSWTDVNEEYEEAVAGFVDALLSESNPFLQVFLPFQCRVARIGALNSLSQSLFKLTVPGVPDVYQGNEIWDFSLVDPDNRRPVDFELRKRLLAELEELDPSDTRTLLEDGAWQDGRPKLYLIWKALKMRSEKPDLFRDGGYMALQTSGERNEHLVAFARRHGNEVAITVAPRLCAKMMHVDGSLLPDPAAWEDTSILLPDELAGAAYRNVLTDEVVVAEERNGTMSLGVGGLLRD
ncbi:MAG TPA: malto-oligosyltrehalose synthase, partial [Rubrobacter sp.]|nr:malto-oligosyltrehalose synthase [Rubrobacter sp.]